MKITLEQQQKATTLTTDLVQKAWENTSFKEQLIENPAKTIKDFTGQDMDLKLQNIIVEDQSDPSFIYLNIPQKIDLENIELTDEQLEIVAGGEVLLLASVLGGAIAFGYYYATSN